MNYRRHKFTATTVAAGLCLFSQAAFAVKFEPGVGLGLEYTDNVTLVDEAKLDDLITVAYVGASLAEDEGALTYDATAAFNHQSYAQDTFDDQRFFNLGASADWEMIKERFNWFLSDTFSQRTIDSLNSNTPDNLQDTNAFTFGANIKLPVTARQTISLIPAYNQYYYETTQTDNKQYSLAANWFYQLSQLNRVGLDVSVREIDYTENDALGQPIASTRFTNMAFVFNGQRLRTLYNANIGSTTVKRDGGDESTGLTGDLNVTTELSSRSKINAGVSSDITDSSSVFTVIEGNDIQVTTEVIRNSVIDLAYSREDALLDTHISARYHKVTSNNDLLDRKIRNYGFNLRFPVTQLLSSSVYTNYNRTMQLANNRLDKRLAVGANLRYRFSQKISGLFDVTYRTKESNIPFQNYDEFSVFASLVYGFGDVGRPSRIADF